MTLKSIFMVEKQKAISEKNMSRQAMNHIRVDCVNYLEKLCRGSQVTYLLQTAKILQIQNLLMSQENVHQLKDWCLEQQLKPHFILNFSPGDGKNVYVYPI